MPASKPYLKSAQGLQLFPHHIQIPGNKSSGSANVTIREQPMANYRRFVECWLIAMGLTVDSPNSTFAQLWINNPDFRSTMEEALNHLGVTEPESILVSHLSELLFDCPIEGERDVRPALFRLHSDSPDPKAIGEILKSPRMKKSLLKSESANSNPSPTFAQRFYKIRAFLTGKA